MVLNPSSREGVRIHPSSAVSDAAKIGRGTQIWLWCQVRENTEIGEDCIFGKGVYVDAGVRIGNRVKVQNNVSLFHGVTVEDGVFIGPHVCFTNDLYPRAVNPDESLKSATDWEVSPTLIRKAAALGANSTIVCGVTVGAWALVASGSVVTKDVPDFAIVRGNPARVVGYACKCGRPMKASPTGYRCDVDGFEHNPEQSAAAT
jgi:UDP-2-acetamido-3-amino-2,3-dideoxy-glucuronate N-acetyltransferase